MKLVRFLMKLANENVIIELRNGTVIKGNIVSVDIAMNTHLSNVKLTVKQGNPISLDNLTIRGNNIRYFHINDHVPIDTHLIDDTPKNKPGKEKPALGRGRGRGRGRVMRGGRGRGR